MKLHTSSFTQKAGWKLVPAHLRTSPVHEVEGGLYVTDIVPCGATKKSLLSLSESESQWSCGQATLPPADPGEYREPHVRADPTPRVVNTPHGNHHSLYPTQLKISQSSTQIILML